MTTTTALPAITAARLRLAIDMALDEYGWWIASLDRCAELGNWAVFRAFEMVAVQRRILVENTRDRAVIVRAASGEPGLYPRRQT